MADNTYDVRLRPVAVTMGVAAACWALAITQMRGMDMGVDTTLGSFGFFVGVWAAMMAAMMLPGAAPAVVGYARTHRRSTASAVVFTTAYVGVWTLFGVAAYGVYRPHGTVAAGIVTVAAGLYELTPVKRRARQRCRQPAASGFHLGVNCVGSSIGLMLVLLALGAMSIAWMAAIAVLVLVQKLLPPRTSIDVAIALVIVAFGVFILIDPSSVPGLVPSM
jgi:predicted metal-binding membrane protein